MKLRGLKRGAAMGLGTLVAAAGLVLGGGGVASANTVAAQVQSYGCYGVLYAAQWSGSWHVYNGVNNTSGSYGCQGWLDISYSGDTSSWTGLIDRFYIGPNGQGDTGWHNDDSPALARACVQASNDTIARCSSWW